MSRRSTIVLAVTAAAAAIAALAGGAATDQARANANRVVDPFTLTASPSPAQLGRRVTFTINARNAGKNTLTHVTFHGAATAGATFDAASSSVGTCGPNAGDPAKVDCDFGKLKSGAEVTATLVYDTPGTASGATSMQFGGLLCVKECHGDPLKPDPGQPSVFAPDPNPITVPLEPQSASKVIDVLDPTGGSRQTDPASNTKNTSTALTVPGTGAFEPISLSEIPTDAGVCGGAATPVLQTSDISAPGTFTTTPLSVVLDLVKSALPYNARKLSKIVGCHDGFKLASCPASGPLPSQGCLRQKQEICVHGVTIFRLTMEGPTNGKWGGGF
jgi:uncharacterized repeat protein (TIGR01451 family)